MDDVTGRARRQIEDRRVFRTARETLLIDMKNLHEAAPAVQVVVVVAEDSLQRSLPAGKDYLFSRTDLVWCCKIAVQREMTMSSGLSNGLRLAFVLAQNML